MAQCCGTLRLAEWTLLRRVADDLEADIVHVQCMEMLRPSHLGRCVVPDYAPHRRNLLRLASLVVRSQAYDLFFSSLAALRRTRERSRDRGLTTCCRSRSMRD